MEQRKRVTVLVTIALILAITAITLSMTDSKEVSTIAPKTQPGPTGAVIGLVIEPTEIEDKLTRTPQ